MKMKIYFNKELIKKHPQIPFLNPILGNNKGEKTTKKQELERTKEGKNLLVISSIEDCDYVVFPKWYYIDSYSELKIEANRAKKYGKKIIVFYHSDNEFPIKIDNAIIFRSSLTKDNPLNEFCYPPIVESICEKSHGKLKIDDVSIGYTGYFDKPSLFLIMLNKIRNFSIYQKIIVPFCLSLTSLIKNSLCINPEQKKDTLNYYLSAYGKGKIFRFNVISKLKQSKFSFVFIKRNKMLNPNEKGRFREEFINNIYSCTFPLVIRGDGNYSYRLYEVMSAGKIPLFIDTNCRLPFEDEIDYKSLFVRVPYDDIENIDVYIEKYLKKNHDLNIIQEKIKKIYKNYIYFPQWCIKIINVLENLDNKI